MSVHPAVRTTPATLLAALLTLACSSQTGPNSGLDNTPLNADIAAAVADGVGEDVETMRNLGIGLHLGFLFRPGPLPGAPARDCEYDPASGRHECEDVTLLNGLVLSRSYAFFDAAGGPMEQYDPIQTASINVVRGLAGEIERQTDLGSLTGSVSHHRDLTVSGLQGSEQHRTWNGGGESAMERTRVVDGRGSRSYELEATVAVADVVVPSFNNQDRDPWPLSGTITKTVTGTVTVNGESRSVERTVVVTFNGTRFPDVTVNGEPFTIDLSTRRAFRRDRP